MLMKKGTPVTVPAPIIEGVVKAMVVVEDDHVEYLVGFMRGDTYVERWFKQENLAVPPQLAEGLLLCAAAVERAFNMQENEEKRAMKGAEMLDRTSNALSAIYSKPLEEMITALSERVAFEVMSAISTKEGA